MTAKIIDGKAIAAQVRMRVKERARELFERSGKKTRLAVVMAGDNPASEIYVRNKIKACEEAGIESQSFRLSADASEQKIIELVDKPVASVRAREPPY